MNKEQFRKELEDCWDAAVEYYDYVKSKPIGYRDGKFPDRKEYLTTRLAAVGDGDGFDDIAQSKSLEKYPHNFSFESDVELTKIKKKVCIEVLKEFCEPMYNDLKLIANKYSFDRGAANVAIAAIERFEKAKPLDDGREGEGQAEDYLKASVGKSLNIDFSKEQWYIDWWMLLDPQPSFRCIIRAMEAYKAALPVDDGEGSIESLMKKAMHSPELLTKEERNKIINHKMTNEQVGEKIEEMALPSLVTGGVKWVELKEGNPLPDYDEQVLWLHEDGNMHVDSLDKDGNPWIFGEEFQGFTYPKATHWMPLPKPPSEGQPVQGKE